MDLHAIVHQEADGTYWAEVKELPGCFASGYDLDELKDGLVEAIALVLAGRPGQTEPMRVDELKLVSA